MISVFYTGIMVVLWVVNLFNNTGLDMVYHVTDIAKYISIIFAIGILILDKGGKNPLMISRQNFSVFAVMSTVFVASSLLHGKGFMAVDYLWVFCLVYIISQLPIPERTFRLTGMIYGIAGIIVLFIYDYGSFFAGWNENSIAMIAMHSFLVFLVQFFDKKNVKSMIFLIAVAVTFSFLISPTNSRSGILFAFAGVLFALGLLPRRWLFKNSRRTVLLLIIPLIISVIVIIISRSTVFEALEAWSIEKFHKPIFNGRDEIWFSGLEMLSSNMLFGTGNLNAGSFHNSAITCLVAYGIVGYVIWIGFFNRLISDIKVYIDDYLVKGCLISFIVLYLQQSVELGFISHSPSIIAYVLLGLALGRVRFLQKEKGFDKLEAEYNNSGI